MRRLAAAVAAALVALMVLGWWRGATRLAAAPAVRSESGPRSNRAAARTVRVLLSDGARVVRLSSAGRWRLYAEDGRTLVALTEPGERWSVERTGGVLLARRDDSTPVTARERVMVARAEDAGGAVETGGKRYRGELVLFLKGDGIAVVNRLALDDYVRGVVPLEIGTSAASDAAAIEAQAITARSYGVTHLAGAARQWDVVATVTDQVYGGMSAETAAGNRAVDATRGQVLMYGRRVVNAPYHATCGGSTAEAPDSWRSAGEPYLRRVSDLVPGTDRFYCERGARYRWTRAYQRDELRAQVSRYVASLPGGRGGAGAVRGVRVTDVTPAGRVGTLTITTDGGSWALRGNEIRAALRTTAGEMLSSTYFSVDVEGSGEVERLVLRGGGYGHGVGMCQAGAIGRARAGQDARTILATYYPGTTIGTLD